MRRDPRYFNVNKSTKICSEHFKEADFIEPDSKKKRLNYKAGVVPSIFQWTKNVSHQRSTSVMEKLDTITKASTDPDMSLEKDVDLLCSQQAKFVHRSTQTSESNSCCATDGASANGSASCSHRFSVSHLRSKCTSRKKEVKLFTHFTGFNSYEDFDNSLQFVLPGLDRTRLIYWQTKQRISSTIDTEKLFEFDSTEAEGQSAEMTDDEGFQNDTRDAHKLPVEDEYLLLLMKLRMGLTNIDLAERFCISDGTVNNILLTWINYLFVTLGCLKIWPHRDVILKNSPKDFLEKYPNTVIIIDATELKIQTPSSLQKHSESYSSYKSHTTLKCLLGVDPRGGIIFISQLYEGSISDKEIVKRSGFLDILRKKLLTAELCNGDAIMADKGFDIENELNTIGLQLNIPPFLKNKVGFEEDDVIRTQTIASHRIHVERAICKIRRFRIFSSIIPVTMLGCINQVWTVACLLSNFQNPVL